MQNQAQINRVVLTPQQHIHAVEGGRAMEEYQFGNTKVVIHSPLASMSSKERSQYYQDEWKKGNPNLKNLVDAMLDIQQEQNSIRKE